MKKILENGQIIGFTDLEPVLSEGQTVEEAESGEYEAWLETNAPKPIHYITIQIPLDKFIKHEELQKKLTFLRLIYSHMESITRGGIIYISKIDITDVLDFLPKKEFEYFKSIGVIFPSEVEALYIETNENEKSD